MNKVELAVMLGLEFDTDIEYIEDSLPEEYNSKEELIELSNYCYNKYSFCEGGVVVVVEESSVKNLSSSPHKYNVSDSDWERYYKTSFIKEYHEMVWEQASDEYLRRIKNAAMTIKV